MNTISGEDGVLIEGEKGLISYFYTFDMTFPVQMNDAQLFPSSTPLKAYNLLPERDFHGPFIYFEG